MRTATSTPATRRARARLAARAILAGCALLAATGAVRARAEQMTAAMTAEMTAAATPPASAGLYDITLADAGGHPQALAQWKGKLLVVNFWATWCAPCVAEMPDLDKLQRELAGSDVQIVGIGVEEVPKVRAFRDQLGLRMTLLAGGYDALALARRFGDQQGVLPYTALFSGDGTLLHARAGALVKDELRRWLASARAGHPR